MLKEYSDMEDLIKDLSEAIDRLALLVIYAGLTIPEDLNEKLSDLAKRVSEHEKD